MSGDKKTEAIEIRRGLTLYKQPLSKGKGSPYWYVRVYMPMNGKTLHTKSTGTTTEKDARKIADEFWGECILKKRAIEGFLPEGVQPPKGVNYRFDQIAKKWLDRLKVRAGANPRMLRNYNDYRIIYNAKNGVGAFFDKMDIGAITKGTVEDYLAFAQENSKKEALAPATLKRHIVVLNGILKLAEDERLIPTIPKMPKITLKDNPRPCFTLKEYQRLYVTAESLARTARKAGNDDEAKKWEELRDFVVFMVNTFLRPSEWAKLQHRHIEVVDANSVENRHLIITVKDGKTKPRQVWSMPTAVDVYKRILARNGSQPTFFLFKNQYFNRTTAKEKMRDDFEKLLKITGLAYDAFDQKRVIYSLRHSSLMFRFIKGDNVNPLTLAKNAGTSVDQLERFYLSRLQPGMMIENLQSFK